MTGDGDCTAIGGNHFIHAARRNIDITTIVMNNNIYGMTSGQYSPMTPKGMLGTTAPYGNVERSFDLCQARRRRRRHLCRAAATAYHVQMLGGPHRAGPAEQGLLHGRGRHAVPDLFRDARTRSAVRSSMLEWIKDQTVNVKAAAVLPPEKLEGKLLIGELYNNPAARVLRRVRQGHRPGPAKVRRFPGRGTRMRTEFRLSGSGGQGLLLAGIVLAEAAILEGKNAVQTQSYGPEARGGASKAEVVISGEDIDYPKATDPDYLLALTTEAYRTYGKLMKKGLIIVDSSVPLVRGNKGPHRHGAHPRRPPPRKSARSVVANIVALGVLAGISGIVQHEDPRERGQATAYPRGRRI